MKNITRKNSAIWLEKVINTASWKPSWKRWCLKWALRNEQEYVQNKKGISGGRKDWAKSWNWENTRHFWNEVLASLAGENFVWSAGMEDQAEEGELRTRPRKILYASLSWLEMKNHWRFLSRTVVRLKVCQWKINLAALLYMHSYWKRWMLERTIRKLMQWSRGEIYKKLN